MAQSSKSGQIFTKARTWEVILDTLLPSAGIKVLEIAPQNFMRIECDPAILLQLEELLSNPSRMKAQIKHAINPASGDVDAAEAAGNVYCTLDSFFPHSGRNS